MLYLWLIILSVGDDVPVNSDVLLMTDFVNLKIKLAQSFRCAHRDRLYVYIFIRMSDQYLRLHSVSKKRKHQLGVHQANSHHAPSYTRAIPGRIC
jgi:hypothetical protein